MEAAINTIASSIEEAKRMLSVAREQLRANNVSDIEALNRRVESLQDATVELVQLHNQILSQKNEVGQMLEELGGLNALAVAGAVSSLPALNDLP